MVATSRLNGWVLALLLAGALVLAPAGVVWAQDTEVADDPAAADAPAEEGAVDEGLAEGEALMGEDAAVGEDAAAAGDLPEALPTLEEGDWVEQTLPPLGFLIDTFQKGGNFMWPLLFCSVLGFAVILERFWTLSRARVNTRKLMSQIIGALRSDGVESAIEVCQRTRGPIAAILHAGLMRARKGPEAVEKAIESAGTIEMSFLQRGLIVLASIANVAPLLGFLGTVSGMINAFEAIAQAEQVSAKLVATGISEALITTASGLIVAIPTQIANNFFISRIDRFVLEMEEASVELVDTLVDMESHQQVG
jgi:biopolymer transport protein ExbB